MHPAGTRHCRMGFRKVYGLRSYLNFARYISFQTRASRIVTRRAGSEPVTSTLREGEIEQEQEQEHEYASSPIQSPYAERVFNPSARVSLCLVIEVVSVQAGSGATPSSLAVT